MKIYATRHGETEWNKLNKICGVSDVSLTEKGIEQAKYLAEKVFEKGDIDRIICSPLERAKITAEYCSKKIGCEVLIDERLTEWNYGSYEGQDVFIDGFAFDKTQFGCKLGGGESLLELSHRVYSLIEDVCKKYENENVLLVCHGGVCRVIEMYFNDMTTEQFSNFFMGNCELREYIIK